MGKRKSNGGSKKCKSKKHREKNSNLNVQQKEEENVQQEKYIQLNENNLQDNVEDSSDIHKGQERPLSDDLNNLFFNTTSSKESKTSSEDTSNTDEADENFDNTNVADDCCEEIKAKQQEMFNKLKNLTESLVALTLVRDNVNSLRVDTLTELYFTRQVRPLLDALNIISFAFSNMTSGAQNIQINTFGDRKEIRHALNLSYKMNDEVEYIIDALGRRIKIFVAQIDKIDKNCPPFD